MSLSPSVSPSAPLAPIPLRLGLALAALAPLAMGAILVASSDLVEPLAGAPAIGLGVGVATSPALYIALAATGDAPSPGGVARALAVALAAFGIALCGFVLPAAFLALSSLSPATGVLAVSAALAGAAALGLWRLGLELAPRTAAGKLVFAIWAVAILAIAGRLWIDVTALGALA